MSGAKPLTSQSRSKREEEGAGCRWLTPVIPATQEVEIRKIVVQSQPEQIVHETLSQKIRHKNRAGRVAQGEGLEFKPQYHKKKKKKKKKRKGAGPSPLHGHAPSDLKISQSSHLLKVPPPASRAQLVTKLLTHGPLEAT
jgi:hypothetical protein